MVNASGAKTPFLANSSNITVPPGGYVVLNSAGTLTFASGSDPIAVALSEGSYSTRGAAGPTTVTLANTGSSLTLAAMTSVQFPSAGSDVTLSAGGSITGGAGTITSGGVTTSFASGSTPTFLAGSTIAFSTPGSVTLSSAGNVTLAGANASVPIAIPAGTSYAVGGVNGTTVTGVDGETLSLTASGLFGSSATFGTGVPIAFPSGTPGTDTLRADQSGIIVAPGGVISSFTANTSNITVTPGSYIVLNAPGTLTFASGTLPIALAVSQGTYSTSGATSLGATPGNLVLANTWDLSTYRFGPDSVPPNSHTTIPAGSGEPGTLALRAAGNVEFLYNAGTTANTVASIASLSDGFDPTVALLSPLATGSSAAPSISALWTAPLLPAGSQSWSFDIVAGADLAAADLRDVLPETGLGSLPSGEGSVLVGLGAPHCRRAPRAPGTQPVTRSTIVPLFFQTIRTGTGDIGIYSSNDIQLLNPLATVYTAGTQAPAMTGFEEPGAPRARCPAGRLRSPNPLSIPPSTASTAET